MATTPLSGSLVHCESDGILFSSGCINGQVSLAGPLSQDRITLGVALRVGSGSRHWLAEVEDGATGVFLPGDEHDALYTPGSLYITATLSAEQLEELAALEDLVLDHRTLGGSRVDSRTFDATIANVLLPVVQQVHNPVAERNDHGSEVGNIFLRQALRHFARMPHIRPGRADPAGLTKVVKLARDYIRENLEAPISIEAIATAAMTSRRTLFRAFSEILDDTPQAYVRRLRLHRIRNDLASDAERACSVSIIANRWGISELGRFSGWYRELFGESPRDTLAMRRGSRR